MSRRVFENDIKKSERRTITNNTCEHCWITVKSSHGKVNGKHFLFLYLTYAPVRKLLKPYFIYIQVNELVLQRHIWLMPSCCLASILVLALLPYCSPGSWLVVEVSVNMKLENITEVIDYGNFQPPQKMYILTKINITVLKIINLIRS